MTSIRTLAHRRQHQRSRRAQAAMQASHTRGERAWRQYRRNGIAHPAAEVFDTLADAYALIAKTGRKRHVALSRETGISVDVLRTFAGISDPRNAHRFTVAAFHARGERAWQQYKHDGTARPAAEVFDDLDALVDRITPANRHPSLLDDASCHSPFHAHRHFPGRRRPRSSLPGRPSERVAALARARLRRPCPRANATDDCGRAS